MKPIPYNGRVNGYLNLLVTTFVGQLETHALG